MLKDRRCALQTAAAMTYSHAELAKLETPAWFCLKAQAKREHLAATALRRELEIACFAPRLRFRRITRRGTVWFVEAMFPAYLFAHFVYAEQHRRILHSPSIRGIVQFGEQVATVAAEAIASMQQYAGEEEVVTIDPEVRVGQAVEIVEGPFQGIHGLVTLHSAREGTHSRPLGISRPFSGNRTSSLRCPLGRTNGGRIKEISPDRFATTPERRPFVVSNG